MDPADYVARLDAALVGPRRVRRGLVREAADHLEDAQDAYVRAGWSEKAAGARAVADFGAVEEVATAFQTTLAVAASRRTAGLLLAILALQPFLWDAGLATLLGVAGEAEPAGATYRVLDASVEYGGGLVMLAAVVLLAAAGIGNRWFRAGRRIARATAWFALGAATVLPVIGTAMTVLTSGRDPAPWLLLGALLVAPLAAVGVSAHRTLAAA